MKAKIQFIDVRIDEQLQDHVNEKLDIMGNHYNWIMDGDVFFKEDNSRNNRNKVAEIHLRTSLGSIYSESRSENLRQACDDALEGAKKQLEKQKTKTTP
jgi:putative sigma-54 modulation protein